MSHIIMSKAMMSPWDKFDYLKKKRFFTRRKPSFDIKPDSQVAP